jgi:flagellar motor switch protein FliN/FliY
MPLLAARRLAAAMMGEDVDESDDEVTDLTEMELSAVGEAMNQMMSAAAVATSRVVDEEVEIAPPVTRIIHEQADLAGAIPPSPHLATVSLDVLGVPCRLVQLVPNAFVVRVTRAMESHVEATDSNSVSDSLRSVDVRVWAELGRARMPAGRLVGLPGGAIVELDRDAEELVDLYVDGMRYATGRLVVCEDDTWGLRIESVVAAHADLVGR